MAGLHAKNSLQILRQEALQVTPTLLVRVAPTRQDPRKTFWGQHKQGKRPKSDKRGCSLMARQRKSFSTKLGAGTFKLQRGLFSESAGAVFPLPSAAITLDSRRRSGCKFAGTACPGGAERAFGKSPVLDRQEDEGSLQPALHSQQRLLIELPAGVKFSTGAYSYQPYNTAGLFKTSSGGMLPEERHARGQTELDGWEESGNMASKSRSGVLRQGAPSLQAAHRLPQPDPHCGQKYHYTLTSTSRV